ncbi:unnamed protein product [Lactuca virosa]|uniref:Lachrymatory-factor synthase n=1 Tax=Lactuca virosa TaxID=75947 RepID=A0AAU9NWQ7_9ASTR|nr:unnamed protein product [Lactuca virosa]
MEEKSSVAKWEGKVSTTVTKASADEIWPLFIDFFNFHNWFPNMSTCYGVHGVNGEVGGIRYCAGFSLPTEDGSAEQNCSWSKERLVAVDRNKMSMSYEMVDCNVGFKSYLSTLKKYQDGLDQTAKKMEDSFVQKKAVQ